MPSGRKTKEVWRCGARFTPIRVTPVAELEPVRVLIVLESDLSFRLWVYIGWTRCVLIFFYRIYKWVV